MSKIKKVLGNGNMRHIAHFLLWGLVVFGSVLAAYYTAQAGQDVEITKLNGSVRVNTTRIEDLENHRNIVRDELKQIREAQGKTTTELARVGTELKNTNKMLGKIEQVLQELDK